MKFGTHAETGRPRLPAKFHQHLSYRSIAAAKRPVRPPSRPFDRERIKQVTAAAADDSTSLLIIHFAAAIERHNRFR